MWRRRESLLTIVKQRWTWSQQQQQHHHRRLSSSSSSSSPSGGADTTATSSNTARNSSRKRHRFHNVEALPSFKDFQLQFQLRSLYRKYLRLSQHRNIDDDLRQQVRTEFRSNTIRLNDRAISEGNRRYKELQNVLQATSGSGSSASMTTTTTTNDWPWNKNRNTKPKVFPPKSEQ